MKISDGNDVIVKCQGQVVESKCDFMEKMLDFGCVPVGIRTKEMNIHVKNKNRTPAVFHLKCDSDELQIQPMVCKIPPDSKQTV